MKIRKVRTGFLHAAPPGGAQGSDSQGAPSRRRAFTAGRLCRSVVLLGLAAVSGCAVNIPDTPRITSGFERQPPMDVLRAKREPVALSVAVHIAPEALASHAVKNETIRERVLDYGELGPHLVAGAKSQAPKAFERVFLTPAFPNPLLWKEGIDVVLVIESARANHFYVKAPDSSTAAIVGSQGHKLFIGWEVALAVGLYTIDGRPLGYHAGSADGAYYKAEAIAPMNVFIDAQRSAAVREKYGSACPGSKLACAAYFKASELLRLENAVTAAMVDAFRRFPAARVSAYLDRHVADIDAEYGRYLARKDDAGYLQALREQGRARVAAITPSVPAPGIDPVAAEAKDLRESAERAQLSAALSSAGAVLNRLQAQNFASMGMHRQAATSTMLSNLNRQQVQSYEEDARRYVEELKKGGLAGLDGDYSALLTLLGGIASYTEYRLQKQARAGIASQAGGSDRCAELLRMRERAIQNRNDLRSATRVPGAKSSGRPTGQAGAQQDAADAFQRIYNAYCT